MRLNKAKVRRQMAEADIAEYQILAQRIDVQPETMSRWFAGTLRPSWERLSDLCAVLDCTVDDLVEYPTDDISAPASVPEPA